MNNLIVGVLALVFVQLSGAVFFCKCNEQVVTVSQLKTSADCCAANCQEEPAPVESTDGCPKDSGSPCNEEIELVFSHPAGAGGQLEATAPKPLVAVTPGALFPELAQTVVLPQAESLDPHPPPGTGRLHLHFQILLI